MLLFIAAVLAGLGLIVWGAEQLVSGAGVVAKTLGVSPLIIGLVVVGIGTSTPEVFIAGAGALQGSPGLAMGNAVGSNIANVALVLGGAAVFASIETRSGTLRREFPLMFAVVGGAAALLYDGVLSRIDGVILMLGFGVVLVLMINAGGKASVRGDALVQDMEREFSTRMALRKPVLRLLAGLALLVVSSKMIVWGASGVAHLLGVGDVVIGLTIVAVGTSLPELAASIASVLKKEPDIAIGNVLGSNMFNLLPVLAMPGLIHPGAVPEVILSRDYPVMVGMTVLFLVAAYGWGRPGRITRFEGIILLCCFVAYQATLFLS